MNTTAFITDLIETWRGGQCSDIDGLDIQNLLAQHGIIVESEATESDCEEDWAREIDVRVGDPVWKDSPEWEAACRPTGADNAQVQDAEMRAREIRCSELLALCLANPRMPGQIGEACDHAEHAIAQALREAERRGIIEGYRIGFETSCEGYNGECVAQHGQGDEIGDENWRKVRDQAIERAAKEPSNG